VLSPSEGFVDFRGYRTWYRVIGGTGIPLLVLHGGPGVPHQSVEPIATFGPGTRPIVFYDQLGCGASDRPEDPALERLDVFLDELAAVRRALDLEVVHLLGHSWGGMLALEYAVHQPEGLRSLTVVGTPAATGTFQQRQRGLHEQLPEDVRATLDRHRSAGTVEHPEYVAARRVWEQRHVYRRQPWPDFLERAYAAMNVQLLVRMWTSELTDWDIRPRLGAIRVPTLIVAGRFDGQVPGEEAALHELIVRSELEVFAASSHHPFAEEPEQFQARLAAFLAQAER
jgi:proline-specific peptidase